MHVVCSMHARRVQHVRMPRRASLLLLSDPAIMGRQAGILHALVPTEAPYLRMLEHYEPAEHASMHVPAAAIETEESNEPSQIIETARLARRKVTNRDQSVTCPPLISPLWRERGFIPTPVCVRLVMFAWVFARSLLCA
jgi:hypothetical protein